MIFSSGLKKEFEIAVVNEPSVFEPLKFYCILILITKCKQLFAIPRSRVVPTEDDNGRIMLLMHYSSCNYDS